MWFLLLTRLYSTRFKLSWGIELANFEWYGRAVGLGLILHRSFRNDRLLVVTQKRMDLAVDWEVKCLGVAGRVVSRQLNLFSYAGDGVDAVPEFTFDCISHYAVEDPWLLQTLYVKQGWTGLSVDHYLSCNLAYLKSFLILFGELNRQRRLANYKLCWVSFSTQERSRVIHVFFHSHGVVKFLLFL